MAFNYLTFFVDSFLNSEWLELMVSFKITIKLVIRVLSRSTLRIRETYDEVWRPVSATFEIETFQEEQQTTIDVFFEDYDVSISLLIGYGKSSIYQAAPDIDRLSSLQETVHYIYCAAR